MKSRFLIAAFAMFAAATVAQADTVAIYDFNKDVGSIYHNNQDGVEAFTNALNSCRKQGGKNCQVIYMSSAPGFVALARCGEQTFWASHPSDVDEAISGLRSSIIDANNTTEGCKALGVYEDQDGRPLTRKDLLSETSQPAEKPTAAKRPTKKTEFVGI